MLNSYPNQLAYYDNDVPPLHDQPINQNDTQTNQRLSLIDQVGSINSVSADLNHLPPNEEENLFNITERVELGSMASMFFNKIGLKLFYFCIAIYLYGDLAIYSAAISKSMRDVTWYVLIIYQLIYHLLT